MVRLSGQALFCLILATSTMAKCSAVAIADPAIDSKSALKNAAEVIEKDSSNNRESHAMKSDVSYSNYLKPPNVPAPPKELPTVPPSLPAVPASQPIPVPVYSNPHETTMGYVYYYLPTVEKYYPKLKDLMPYFKRYEKSAMQHVSRAWPAMRQMADRTFDLTSAIGLVILAPALFVSIILFLGFVVILFLFPAVSAFGKRRMGRDLNGVEENHDAFDFDSLLPLEQSRSLVTLAARVDNVLENYKRALQSDACLERLSCEAGHFSSRIGKFAEPMITFIEPLLPSYMYKKLEAFKNGARSGRADCNQMTCKFPLIG